MARIDECMAGTASWWDWGLDQLGHAGLGAACAFPSTVLILAFTTWGVPMALIVGSAAALLGGVAREAVQAVKTEKAHPLDRAVDALFHLPGAPVALGLALLGRMAF
jgi:hypothetical protein